MSDLDLPKHMSCERYDRLEREAELDEQARREAFELMLEAELELLCEDDFRGINPNLGPTWEQALYDREQELRHEYGYEKGGK